MTVEQIILQTIGDVWLCCAFTVVIASSIQTYKDFKGIK